MLVALTFIRKMRRGTSLQGKDTKVILDLKHYSGFRISKEQWEIWPGMWVRTAPKSHVLVDSHPN